MNVIKSVSEIQSLALQTRDGGRRIGLVPTMGYLHEGHMSLVRLARSKADVVVVSIFVNPTQFGPMEDFGAYPRDFDADLVKCSVAGVDIVFAPSSADVYATDASVYIVEERLSSGLCGASRPGHFRGVATIVAKLFNMVLPHVAVFGQKDAQQVRVIQRMVRDLNFPVEIVVGATLREADGLAMSSRNAYLGQDERRRATCLHRALQAASGMIASRAGARADELRQAMERVIEGDGGVIDYIAIVDNETLSPVSVVDRTVLIALAVKIGRTRLIDNAVFKPLAAS